METQSFFHLFCKKLLFEFSMMFVYQRGLKHESFEVPAFSVPHFTVQFDPVVNYYWGAGGSDD